ncbi:MAG: hypothetical protein IPP99_19200 [Chitinophagaceae bacterium]|nr:hypothetical protein [Chitinophagaceae bacterium]MBP6588522.1 hypothetical protein [Chitinophagaceae bacterium]
MKLVTTGKMAYQLYLDDGHFAGSLIYKDACFDTAEIFTDSAYILEKSGAGNWVTRKNGEAMILVTSWVELDGKISIQYGTGMYSFVKPINWKPRFCLLNSQQEEVAAFIPTINWELNTCNFSIQLNEEFSNETEAFLILQALHCAVCGMAMINGLTIPAIGNLNG